MKISKRDALMWFEFFPMLEEEGLSARQQEIAYAVLSQIETAVEARTAALQAQIPHLKTLSRRTTYVGPQEKFPRGCAVCLCGSGLTAIRKTNRCNLRCKFCYDYGVLDCQEPIGEGYWEIGGTKFREEDMDLLLDVYKKPAGVCYVYLEPFMEIEKYYGMVRRFAQAGVWQHLYTNGTLVTQENVRALAEAGLNELRFNLGGSDCADRVIDNMALAKKYIPRVGIETPMTREFYAAFHEKKEKILATGIDFMNLAELHLGENNLSNYLGENMVMYRRGYLSPIVSHELTLRLMREADEESWDICVHDCDNRTKFARDLHARKLEGGWFGASGYGAEFDTIPFEAFLPVLRDEAFSFLEEEPLPEGFRPQDVVL